MELGPTGKQDGLMGCIGLHMELSDIGTIFNTSHFSSLFCLSWNQFNTVEEPSQLLSVEEWAQVAEDIRLIFKPRTNPEQMVRVLICSFLQKTWITIITTI